MKTKQVIELLLNADPTGELQCVVNGKTIHSIVKTPGNHEGWYEVLNRDPVYSNIISGEMTTAGDKVALYAMSIKDAIYEFAWNHEDFPVKIEIEDEERKRNATGLVKKWRAEAKDLTDVAQRTR